MPIARDGSSSVDLFTNGYDARYCTRISSTQTLPFAGRAILLSSLAGCAPCSCRLKMRLWGESIGYELLHKRSISPFCSISKGPCGLWFTSKIVWVLELKDLREGK